MAQRVTSELAVGVFVVIALALGVGIILWLGAADLLAPEGQEAVFYTPQSSGALGLKEGFDVTLGDKKIGKIIDVRLDPQQRRCMYRVRLHRGDIRIRSDARAAVDSPPLGMPKLVVYEVGRNEQLADDEHPVELTPGGLTKAMNDLASVTEKLKEIASSVQEELDPDRAEALLAKIHAIVSNIRRETDRTVKDSIVARLRRSTDSVETLAARLKDETDPNVRTTLLAKVHQSLDDIQQASNDVRKMIGETRPKVTRITDNLVKTTDKVEKYVRTDVANILKDFRAANTKILKIANDLSKVSEQTRQIVTLNRDNIDKIIDDLAQASDSLKAGIKDLRRNPWKLLSKPDEEEIETQAIYDAARSYSQGAANLNQALSKAKLLHKQYPDGIDPNHPELPKIRKSLIKAFDRFQKVEKALWDELEKKN